MDLSTTSRDEQCININNAFSVRKNVNRILLILAVLWSFLTIDTAMLYTSSHSETPEIWHHEKFSSDSPVVDDMNTDESVKSDTSRRMETTEVVDKHGEAEGLKTTTPTKPQKQMVQIFHNTTENSSTPPEILGETDTNERIAFVLRSMDPIKPNVLARVIQIAEILQKEEFKNYDFHILVDQTKQRITSTETLQGYFRANNAGHVKAPAVFSVNESMILKEFPQLAEGYVKGPLVDGKPGKCCGQPLMWQLLMPTFVTFVHYHQDYDYTWVFEDDLWSMGTPIVELLRTFDEKLRGKNTGLVGRNVSTDRMPYTSMMKEHQTFGFRDILIAMKATGWQYRNKTLLEMDGQVRSPVWNEWGANRLPMWSCVSDTLYRHSRDFGNYVYSMVKSNVYQFVECYQMPLAWYGGFSITDIKTILPNTEDDYVDGRRDEPGLTWELVDYNRKLTVEEAEIKFRGYQQTTKTSALIYHEMFLPPSGQEFRTKREHPKLCSLSFDFRQDVVLPSDCEKMLEKAPMKIATGVIFIGNNPIFKIFQNFLVSKKKQTLPYEVLLDDKMKLKKNALYYRYPSVDEDEWAKKSTELQGEIFGEKVGTAFCKRCRQAKLQSTYKNLKLESLLVEASRDYMFPTQTTETTQETVAKWISEHYHDPERTVCILKMNGLEMKLAPQRTKSEFVENTKNFFELLKPSCGTFIQFGILPHFSSRSLQDIVSWDEGLRDLVLDDSTINGYFIDVSGAKKTESNDRYTKPLWQMFCRLMGLPAGDFA